jgi:tellurite resistance-related uncharacterized protein
VLTKIVGFHHDATGAWVADLACGHAQHVRHEPPWQVREWTLTEAGRNEKLGTELDCPYCNMGRIPDDVAEYKRTRTFTESDVPEGLLRDHQTKPGTWGRLVVEEGRLEYTCRHGTFVLKPGTTGVIEPEQPHHVRVIEPVRFHVVFLRPGDG